MEFQVSTCCHGQSEARAWPTNFALNAAHGPFALLMHRKAHNNAAASTFPRRGSPEKPVKMQSAAPLPIILPYGFARKACHRQHVSRIGRSIARLWEGGGENPVKMQSEAPWPTNFALSPPACTKDLGVRCQAVPTPLRNSTPCIPARRIVRRTVSKYRAFLHSYL